MKIKEKGTEKVGKFKYVPEIITKDKNDWVIIPDMQMDYPIKPSEVDNLYQLKAFRMLAIRGSDIIGVVEGTEWQE